MTEIKLRRLGDALHLSVKGHTDSRTCAFISGITQAVLEYAREYTKVLKEDVKSGSAEISIIANDDIVRLLEIAFLGISNAAKVEIEKG